MIAVKRDKTEKEREREREREKQNGLFSIKSSPTHQKHEKHVFCRRPRASKQGTYLLFKTKRQTTLCQGVVHNANKLEHDGGFGATQDDRK